MLSELKLWAPVAHESMCPSMKFEISGLISVGKMRLIKFGRWHNSYFSLRRLDDATPLGKMNVGIRFH